MVSSEYKNAILTTAPLHTSSLDTGTSLTFKPGTCEKFSEIFQENVVIQATTNQNELAPTFSKITTVLYFN